jgi:hypothetical protein
MNFEKPFVEKYVYLQKGTSLKENDDSFINRAPLVAMYPLKSLQQSGGNNLQPTALSQQMDMYGIQKKNV